MSDSRLVWLVAVVVLLVLGGGLQFALARAWRRFKLGRRWRRARRGEADAEQLLRGLGFAVLGRQVRTAVVMEVDDEPAEVEVQADYVAVRRGQRAVVEVKTGSRAPDPCHLATRRQLLEYAVAFPGHDIMLADMEARTVRVVRFPEVGGAGNRWTRSWLVATLLAALAFGAGYATCLGLKVPP